MVTFSLIPVILSAVFTIKNKSYLECELNINDKYFDAEKSKLDLKSLDNYERLFLGSLMNTMCKYLILVVTIPMSLSYN